MLIGMYTMTLVHDYKVLHIVMAYKALLTNLSYFYTNLNLFKIV